MSNYIKYSLLGEIWDRLTQWEGTEWGDQMRALSAAFEMGQDYAGFEDDEMDAIERILRRHVIELYEYGDLQGAEHSAGGYDEYSEQEFNRAVKEIKEEIIPNHLKQASDAEKKEQIAAIIRELPEWLQ